MPIKPIGMVELDVSPLAAIAASAIYLSISIHLYLSLSIYLSRQRPS